MTEHHLRILHISDLHERVALDWMDDARQRRVHLGQAARHRVLGAAMAAALAEIRQAGPLDLVCFTGDAADWGLAEEFGLATARLHSILAALGVPRQRLFVIPGNHDVQRLPAADTWQTLRGMVWNEQAGLSDLMAGVSVPRGLPADARAAVLTRTAAFWAWVAGDLGRADLLPADNPHGYLGYRVAPDLGLPFAVHLIGLDSAWLCGDDHDAEKLLLTQYQLDALTAGGDGAPLPGFRLALAHHPLAFLADAADARRRLADRVDLVLHGHQHDPIAEDHADPDRALRVLAAGSLYEGDRGDRWLNSFHVVDAVLDEAGRPLRYDVEFWGWSERGHWHRTGAMYKAAPDGHLRWWTALGLERRPPASPPPDLKTVFVGREDELADLERALLAEGGAAHRALVCGAHGMAGVGKTWLVEHFFAWHSDAFPGGLVRLVLDPTTSTNAEALRGRLADALNVRRDAVADALRGGDYLVHVENVDSRPLAEATVSLAEGLPGARLAVSGRFTAFQERPGWRVIALRPFDVKLGVKQLADELNADAAARVPDADRQTLVGALGGLPLAIHLAAGYLNAGHSAAGFLASLRGRGLDLAPFDVNDRAYAHRAEQALSAVFDLSLTLFEAARPADLPALLALGVAPRAGFGVALAAAVMDRETFAAEEVLVEAAAVSLVERVPVAERADAAWRVHALVAERLRARLDVADRAAEDRLAAWFLHNLDKGEEDSRGARWQAVEAEREGLIQWLAARPAGASYAAVMAGYDFGLVHGPLAAWLATAARALQEVTTDRERSNALWRQGNLARQAGELDLALRAAQAKETLDLAGGAEHEREVALARGLRANVLAARGEVDEALRIRREEELPVYERLGDVQARAVTMGKIADVLAARGEVDEALRILRDEVLPAFERLGDVRERAVTMGKIADVLADRGEVDEALRIRREEELPVYERLGDVRARAVTMGKIADMLADRGEVDEALRIRREEELPVFERLGDVRSRAVTMGKIADVLAARGEVDEALRIRREEQLPVFERLGDVRSRAVTMGQIADVLAARGEVDEALRIRREEQLPVYERLGDVRSRAVTMGKIADVLAARGEVDEALRIRREEQLPVYERLGDVRSRAVTMGKIADVLAARGEVDEALRIRREEELPVYERLGDVRSRAVTMGKIADVLAARGEVDEALRIRREEQLPVYERLGDVRALLVGRANLALTLLRRGAPGDHAEAVTLLRMALVDARRLRLPEAGQIQQILAAIGASTG